MTTETGISPKLSIRNDMITHIMGINKCLTREHLDTLDNHALLANVHPLYRSDYYSQLYGFKSKFGDKLSRRKDNNDD